MVLDEGQVLDGKYVIVRVLATGSMGEVYLGRNERIGKEVAVKVMRRDLADDRAIVNRFEQEARIATAVKSSHVVDVYDLGELTTGERFIVMEYVDGESLGMRMAREGKLSARALGAITLQILDGLIAAHAAGVIHRDLKPDNVILTKRDGQEVVKLVDFGISKRAEAGAGRDRDPRRATLDGTLLGTPMFMSPEQARGDSGAVDHRTDIFSLGVSMYEALSGEVPFNADNVVSLLSRIIDEAEMPLEERVPGVDPGLARIVKKAMAKDPSDRYQTAADMREAVAAWYAVFGSTSAMRSSLEGVERADAPPSSVRALADRILGLSIDRKHARVALASAAVAALVTVLVMHGSSGASAPATTMAPRVTTASTFDVVTVPTVAATATAPRTAVAPMNATPPASLVLVPRNATAEIAPTASPSSPAAKAHPKKTTISSPDVTLARSGRALHSQRPAALTEPDAGAIAALEAVAPSTRDASATLPKIDDVAPATEATETPLPDPPATP